MSSSSAVLGNPGDGWSGMEFRAVVHFMEAASKNCWSATGFCKLLATLSLSLSLGTNRGLTPARTYQDRRKLFVPAVAGRETLGVPNINRPWCCHSDMVFWLGFAPLAFGSVKNLYHNAVVYKSAWQGCQTPWGIAIPEVLQYLKYCNICIPQFQTTYIEHMFYHLRDIRRIRRFISTTFRC